MPKKPRRDRSPLPVVRLDAAPVSDTVVTADLRMTIGGEPVHLAITVPAGPARVADLLPVAWGLADVVVGVGVRNAERGGAKVSCKAGCGACCRQPVPVSESEAQALKRLVDGMPEPRRTEVRGRFAAAVQRLAEAGLLDRLRDTSHTDGGQTLSLDYFRIGIPCPFLEAENCSIHPHRPVACREYLVTSPAEECGRPDEGRIDGVPLPAEVGKAVRGVDRQSDESAGWVPMVLALEWAEAHPDGPTHAAGPDLLMAFLSALTGRPATA